MTRFGFSPKEEINFLVNCIQFTFGCEIECAAHVPVAPPNFPAKVILIFDNCQLLLVHSLLEILGIYLVFVYQNLFYLVS